MRGGRPAPSFGSMPTKTLPLAVATFLVERYWPGVTVAAFEDAQRRLSGSVDRLRAEGVAIGIVAATLVAGDEAAYWVVDAPSADAIELACTRAGLTVDRIVDALDLRLEHGRAMPVAGTPAEASLTPLRT